MARSSMPSLLKSPTATHTGSVPAPNGLHDRKTTRTISHQYCHVIAVSAGDRKVLDAIPIKIGHHHRSSTGACRERTAAGLGKCTRAIPQEHCDAARVVSSHGEVWNAVAIEIAQHPRRRPSVDRATPSTRSEWYCLKMKRGGCQRLSSTAITSASACRSSMSVFGICNVCRHATDQTTWPYLSCKQMGSQMGLRPL
jgi:hypothetical protein